MRKAHLIDTFIHAAYSGDINTLGRILEQEPWLLNHVVTPMGAYPTTALTETLRNNQNHATIFLSNKGANITLALELLQVHYQDTKDIFNNKSKAPQYSLLDINKKISKIAHPPVKRRPPNL